MVAPSSDTYRARLEGRAELLEAARLRYRELLDTLRAPNWEERVRARAGGLRDVGAEQERVDAALAMALRRARAEGWPESSSTVRMLHETQALRDACFLTAARRLGAGVEGASPTGLLRALEDHARCAPREVVPARRWSVAVEVLPDDLPALRDVSTFGTLLRDLFAEPRDFAGPPPLRDDDLAVLRRQWPVGEAALSVCWARLAGVDPAGGVEAEVRKRAGRESHHAPHDGPEHLARAEYWFQTARAWLDSLVRERLENFQPTPAEWPDVSFWLCARERSPDARLGASNAVPEVRAGLFELAYELWEALHPERFEAERWPEHRWMRMVESARRAAPASLSPEASRVRGVLRTFIVSRSVGTSMARGWWEPDSLEGLVLRAWEAARVDA
ncbi:hypothetical protein [Myxococcus sp. RHSTA-1-4]|uniref:hypothetical protein n=1 Tax=Myxococcus sp. RHSTA-1-4 TaxID=2874601 RepID=UPI001CBBDDA7|nr:hypothetical protein [Myxococcus sp. RHSTA-1-4]MBZ4415785.1 hypothetical protein [Myxococcus sp. RHSTA-1-4]